MYKSEWTQVSDKILVTICSDTTNLLVGWITWPPQFTKPQLTHTSQGENKEQKYKTFTKKY